MKKVIFIVTLCSLVSFGSMAASLVSGTSAKTEFSKGGEKKKKKSKKECCSTSTEEKSKCCDKKEGEKKKDEQPK